MASLRIRRTQVPTTHLVTPSIAQRFGVLTFCRAVDPYPGYAEAIGDVINLLSTSKYYLNLAHSTPFERLRKALLTALEAGLRVPGIANRWLAIPETAIVARNIKITRNNAGQTHLAIVRSVHDFLQVLQHSAPSVEDPSQTETRSKPFTGIP